MIDFQYVKFWISYFFETEILKYIKNPYLIAARKILIFFRWIKNFTKSITSVKNPNKGLNKGFYF